MSKSDVGDGAITQQDKEGDACWQRIKGSLDPCSYEEFAARFPDSTHAPAACLKSEAMIRTCNDWTQLEQFLRDYGSSERIPLALSRLRELDLNRLGTQSAGMPLLTLLRDKIQASPSPRELIWRLRRALGPLKFYTSAAAALLVIALYVLLPSKNGLPKVIPGTLETDAMASRELGSGNTRSEDKDFRMAIQAGTREALETYLLQNPKGSHAGDARRALEKLDDEAFGSAERANTVQAYRDYMDAWPNGRNAAAGSVKISDLEAAITDDKSFEAAESSGNREALEAYLTAHTKGRHVAEARHNLGQLDTAAYQAATKLNNQDAYRNYLQVWPSGQHIVAAELHISELEKDLTEDDSDYAKVEALFTKSALETYLGGHPQGRHAQEAAEKLNELEAIAYEVSVRANTEQSYQDYLTSWPNARHTAIANVRLSELNEARLAEDHAFKVAKEQNTKEALEGYLMSNAHGLHTREAQESLDALEATAYETAERVNTEQSYGDYLISWPNGSHSATANVRLSELKDGRLADDQAFKVAKEQNTKEALAAYLMSNARGFHTGEAQESLDALEVAAYEAAERANSIKAYEGYLAAWPQGAHKAVANSRLSEVRTAAESESFKAAKRRNTREALEGYLAAYPQGVHAREVRDALNRIGWAARGAPSVIAEKSEADAGAGSIQTNNKPSTNEKPTGQENRGAAKKRPDPDEYAKYVFEGRTFRAGETFSKQTRHGRLICEGFKNPTGETRSRCRWDQATIP